MKNIKKSLFLISSLIILIGLGWYYQSIFLNKPTEYSSSDTEQPLSKKATVTINNGSSIVVDQIIFHNAATAFDLLQKMAEKNKWEIETTDYGDMGLLIESINEVKNGADNKYWMYYINSKQPQVSASKQIVNNNDFIEFKFEKSNF